MKRPKYLLVLLILTASLKINSRSTLNDNEVYLIRSFTSNASTSNDTVIYRTKYNHVRYFNSGKLKELGHIKNGKKNGYWISFYENLKNDKVENYKNGKLSGDYWKFHPNGNINEQGKFKKGKKNGEWKYWNEKGELQKIEFYKNGKLIENNKDGKHENIEFKQLDKKIPVLTYSIRQNNFT